MTDQEDLHKRIADFARTHLGLWPDLSTRTDFPMELWRKMGETGLHKIALETAIDGDGIYLRLLKAGEAFVQNGFPLGLAMAWLYQQILATNLFNRFGTAEQKNRYLPVLAAGKQMASFAVSEPGHGAHPKKLTTRAIPEGSTYLLQGEKTYLTCGPLADVFIVIAVTDETASRRRFSAFLVDRHTSGMTVLPSMKLEVLHPCPHGGIVLDQCRVGPDALLGPDADAWTEMVVAVGEIEDIVMTGPVLGAIDLLLTRRIALLRQAGLADDRSCQHEIGQLHAISRALRVIACQAAASLDTSHPSIASLPLMIGRLIFDFQTLWNQSQESHPVALDAPLATLKKDMDFLVSLRRRLLGIKQEKIGKALLKAQ